MPDERRESIEQGIAAPKESSIGRAAEAKRRDELVNAPESTHADSAMGGTSDVDSPADESAVNSVRNSDDVGSE